MIPLPVHIASLRPYQSARSLYKGDGWIFMDANESPLEGWRQSAICLAAAGTAAYGETLARSASEGMEPVPSLALRVSVNRYPDPTADALRQSVSAFYGLGKQNVMMVGQSGLGKSHLMEGIGRCACVRGYRVRYTLSDKLLEDLGASLADGTTPRLVRAYSSFDLLIIDGFGFDRLERERYPQALSLLYKVIEQRNQRRSTALVTNIEFDAWASYLGDGAMVMALLDRLMDRAVRLKIKGKSYRAHRAEQIGVAGDVGRAGSKGNGRKQR